jgi:hypothetical protein
MNLISKIKGKMNRIIILLVFAWISCPVLAQDEEESLPQDPKAREKINAARVAYITERLGFTPDEAEKFWPIYREFSQKRQELRREYNSLKRNPDQNKTLEQNEKALLDLGFKIKQQELDLEKTYSDRLIKVVSAQKIMALRKAEKDFVDLVIKQIQQRQLQQDRRQQFRERSQQRLQQRNN